MRCRYLGVLLIVAVALFAGYTVYSSNQTETRLTDLSLMNIESVAGENDEIDGGELPGVGITCNYQGSGKCYQPNVHYEYGSYCSLTCDVSGDPSDYCNSLLMGILELCINFLY